METPGREETEGTIMGTECLGSLLRSGCPWTLSQKWGLYPSEGWFGRDGGGPSVSRRDPFVVEGVEDNLGQNEFVELKEGPVGPVTFKDPIDLVCCLVESVKCPGNVLPRPMGNLNW